MQIFDDGLRGRRCRYRTFPFSDRLAEKRRPALVVSGTTLAAHGMVWVVMITSSRLRGTTDCPISDRAAAGLEVECVVRPTKIAGVEPARISRRAGRIGDRELRDVMHNIRAFVQN